MRVCEARERYLRWLESRDLSPHTVRAYGGDVSALERHLGVGAVVAAISREDLSEFIAGQRGAGLSATSLRRRGVGVRAFCRWLVWEGLLAVDPWAELSVPPVRSRTLPRVLSASEVEQLLGSLNRDARLGAHGPGDILVRPHEATTLLGVALMLATGVRVHEVISIACADVDLSSRIVRLMGKGRRERQVFLTNDWITNLTSAYLNTRVALGIDHPRLLFNRGGAPLSTQAMRSRVRRAAIAAGLRRRVTPHMLRHTAATQLMESSVDIRFIQRLLGHASLSTTEIYTHVSDRALLRVVSDADVLGRLLDVR